MNLIDGKKATNYTNFTNWVQYIIRKIFFVVIFILICFTITTCKKISKYELNMIGEWSAPDSKCKMSIVINKDYRGTYESNTSDLGCGSRPVKGKVRYTNTHLYIGLVSFKFVIKPESDCSNDSVYAFIGQKPKKKKIIATMTLHNSKLYSGEVIKYYKVTDY